MATSDAGYLQSRYELANLLRIVNFNTSDDFGCLTGNRYDGQPANADGNRVVNPTRRLALSPAPHRHPSGRPRMPSELLGEKPARRPAAPCSSR